MGGSDGPCLRDGVPDRKRVDCVERSFQSSTEIVVNLHLDFSPHSMSNNAFGVFSSVKDSIFIVIVPFRISCLRIVTSCII